MGITTGSGYDAYYFATGCGRPYARNEEWLALFARIAARVERDIGPRTVLDAGCAFGFLVECLRRDGIDAHGIDASSYAIGQVDSSIRDYCRIASVTEPLDRTYDLIVCIEVLEHLEPEAAETALDNFTAHSADILFSSTPTDYMEASHVNVRPPQYWAEAFARRGFLHDLAFDASFITPWAVRFRKSAESPQRIVAAYEARLWELTQELEARRKMNVDQRAELARMAAELARLPAAESEAERAEIAVLRRALDETRAREVELARTPGGRILGGLQRFRAAAAPPGSRRDRGLDVLFGSGDSGRG